MTIGEYFSQMNDAEDLGQKLLILCFGYFPDVGDRKLASYKHWDKLLKHCEDAIEELKNLRFRGGPSCYLVCDMGMKRLMRQDGLKAPGPWVPVLRELKALPEEKEESEQEVEASG